MEHYSIQNIRQYYNYLENYQHAQIDALLISKTKFTLIAQHARAKHRLYVRCLTAKYVWQTLCMLLTSLSENAYHQTVCSN